jgi:polar amino acid transport system substrate-binding protein
VLGIVLSGESGIAKDLRGGWSGWVPYQYKETTPSGAEILSGLDIEVMRAASRKVGAEVQFEQVPWEENLHRVREGSLDFAQGATREKSREAYAWFSRPYRKESIYLFARKGDGWRWRKGSALESLKALRDHGGRVAVEKGYYCGPEVAALLAEPSERDWVTEAPNASAALVALLSGEADVLLADRLAGPSLAWDDHQLEKIEECGGPVYEADLCFMFSRKTVSPETVAAYDRALDALEASGDLKRLSRSYLVPRLLMMTLGSSWFSALEIVGTIAFAISGVIIARRENYDIIGAAVLAFLPALGGGVLRDLITGREPIGILRDSSFILIVLATVLTGFVFFVVRDLLAKGPAKSAPTTRFRWWSTLGLLEITDAMGLASFTIIGVTVAVEQRCEPLWLWGPIMACLTGAGGGVLRDILRAQADIPTLKGSVYPEIALAGGFFYSMALIRRTDTLHLTDVTFITLFIVCAVFGARLLVVQFGIRSLFLASPFKRALPVPGPGRAEEAGR